MDRRKKFGFLLSFLALSCLSLRRVLRPTLPSGGSILESLGTPQSPFAACQEPTILQLYRLQLYSSSIVEHWLLLMNKALLGRTVVASSFRSFLFLLLCPCSRVFGSRVACLFDCLFVRSFVRLFVCFGRLLQSRRLGDGFSHCQHYFHLLTRNICSSEGCKH